MKEYDDFINLLKSRTDYRGQCVYSYKREYVKPEIKIVKEQGFQVLWKLNNQLFSHQHKCLNAFNNGKNILLQSSYYSGKTTISMILAIKKIFNDAKMVLYIAPDEYSKKIQKENIRTILEELNYEWLVEPEDIVSLRAGANLPKIFVTDIYYLHSKLVPNHSIYPLFWNSLGLIIIDNFEAFSGNLASNSANVMKRLMKIIELNGGKPQFFVTSRPFLNFKDYAQRFTGISEFTIIEEDGAGINKSNIYYWVPPIALANIEKIHNDQYSLEFSRDDFFKEVISLALEGISNGYNTVIYYSDLPLRDQELDNYRNEINQKIQERKLQNPGKWILGNNLDRITMDIKNFDLSWNDIHLIIISGFNGPIDNILANLTHLGAKGCNIFFVFPQYPYYQYFINEAIDNFEQNNQIRLERRNAIFAMNEKEKNIFKKHFLFYLDESLFNEKDIDSWGGSNIINELRLEGKVSDEKIELSENGKKYLQEILKYEGKDLNILSFDTSYKVKFTGSNKAITLIDQIEAINYFYQNATINLSNERYRITKFDPTERTIEVNISDIFTKTFPCPKNVIINNEKINISNAFNDILTISFCEGDISFVLDCLKTSDYLKFRDINTLRIDPEIELKAKIDYIKFSGFENKTIAHTFAHSYFSVLRTLYLWKDIESLRFLFPENDVNSIIFYSTCGIDQFQIITDHTILRNILEQMFYMLTGCPCESGCAGCLYLLECPELECDFDKINTILFIGKLIGKDNLAELNKIWKISHVKEYDKLLSAKKEVLIRLKHKADMNINDPYKPLFFTEDLLEQYPGCAGLCDSSKKIVYTLELNECNLVEVLAHEYTHNWQFEDNLDKDFEFFNIYDIDDSKNILFAGKIFLEGQAMYGATKVLDFYGLDKSINSMYSRTYFQYKEGMKLLIYLEKLYGLKRLLEILKKRPSEINYKILNEWYEKSGVYSGIVGEADFIRNNGGLICFKQNYLNKSSNDLNRVSFHLSSIYTLKKKEEKLIGELIQDENNAKIIWKHLKDAIKEVTGKKPSNDVELPCFECSQKDKESLEEVCILFKSKKYEEKIKNELNSSLGIIRKLSKEEDE